MKINIAQTIEGIDGQEFRQGITRPMQLLFQNIMKEIENQFGKESTDQLMGALEKKELLPRKETVRDVLMTALMASEGSRETMLKDYRLLRQLEAEDEPDLDFHTCDRLMDKVAKVYQNVVLIGKLTEVLIDPHPPRDDAEDNGDRSGE